MRAKKTLKLCVTIPGTTLPLATAITTLVFMGHNNHWSNIGDEWVATPVVVVGFTTALVMFILTCIVADS